MKQPKSAMVFVDLPQVAGRGALRGGLTALGLVPRDLPAADLPRALAENPASLAFADVSPAPGRCPLLELDALLPKGPVRSRVVLTRLAGGYVTPAEQRWATELGFRDLLCGFDSQHGEGQVRHAVELAAQVLELASPPADRLARYIATAPDDMYKAMPWRTVRESTGMAPDQLLPLLMRSLDLRDRNYLMQTYEDCFVGSEAAAWLEQQFQLQRAQALDLGNAMVALGLLVHVVQEHPFRDEALFYRLAASPAAARIGLGAVAGFLSESGAVAVADRTFHGRRYEQCWVGSEAVDALCARWSLRRHDAWVLLHRLAQFGAFAHVTGERPFLDGEFFYRFAWQDSGAVRPRS